MAIDETGVSFIKGSTDLSSNMSDLQQFFNTFVPHRRCTPGQKGVPRTNEKGAV